MTFLSIGNSLSWFDLVPLRRWYGALERMHVWCLMDITTRNDLNSICHVGEKQFRKCTAAIALSLSGDNIQRWESLQSLTQSMISQQGIQRYSAADRNIRLRIYCIHTYAQISTLTLRLLFDFLCTRWSFDSLTHRERNMPQPPEIIQYMEFLLETIWGPSCVLLFFFFFLSHAGQSDVRDALCHMINALLQREPPQPRSDRTEFRGHILPFIFVNEAAGGRERGHNRHWTRMHPIGRDARLRRDVSQGRLAADRGPEERMN